MPEKFDKIRVSRSIRDSLRRLGHMGDTYDDVISRLISESTRSESSPTPSPTDGTEASGLQTSWEPRSLEVAKTLYGSPERAAEAFSWLLDVFATVFNLETDEALLETLGLLHEIGDNSTYLRSIMAMGALENLIEVEGFEKLRPQYDYVVNVINANIEGEPEPPRQEQ